MYLIVELLGLPVDIFNLKMVKSENSIGIAQGFTARNLNWVYMVINFIIMISTAIILIVPGLKNLSSFGIMILVFFAFNLPGLALLFTQVNALLYIYKAKRVTEKVTKTNPPPTTQVPPRPTQEGADPQVAAGSAQKDPAEAGLEKQDS